MASVIGYRIIFDTDTEKLDIRYRIGSELLGQTLTSDVPRAMVDMGMGGQFKGRES